MKKKHIIIIVIIAVLAVFAVLAFIGGELIGAFPWQYIKEDKVDAFVEDSSYAFIYELPTADDKIEFNSILTCNLANKITAAAYAARNDFTLDTQDNDYIISNDEFDKEKSELFGELKDQTFEDSQLLTAADNGYLLHLKNVQDSDLSYEIVDTFLGLKGSELTSVTVRYTLNGQQCELEYLLTEDKSSPYTFKVVDINLCENE